MILDSSIDRPRTILMCIKTVLFCLLGNRHLKDEAYPFDCTFFTLIRLTAKALRRTTMCGFLVGATEREKSTLKRF